MADEQTPPKRDVNELFTLDASEPPSVPDGPLAHLLSMSPLADLGRQSVDTADVDPGPPGLADVSGLEDLFVTTADVPLGDTRAEPLPPTTISSWATDVVDRTPVDLWPVDEPTIDLPTIDLPTVDLPTIEPAVDRPTDETPTVDHQPVRPRLDEPIPVHLDAGVDSDRFRSFEVGGNLRFSTEAGYRSVEDWSATGGDQPYPAALLPYAVPAPVSPGRSVRVPGQERRRGVLPTALIEITERRWFWASTVGVLGLILLVLLLAVGDFVPNPLARDRIVVTEERAPTAPAVGGATETSNADTSSSTGAGSGTLQRLDSATSSESTAMSTPTTAARRIITTARPTARSTTPASTSTTASSSTSSTVSSTATTVPTSSTSTSASSSSTTGSSTSTTTETTTDTTETTGSSSTTEGPTTTSSTQASGSTDP